MYKAVNHPACCNWKASGRYSQSHTYSGQILVSIQCLSYGPLAACRSVFFSHIGAQTRDSVPLQFLCDVMRTAAGSLQSEHELTPRTEFIALLATGWHFVLLKDRPTQQHLQRRDLLKALETWEWLTLRSSGAVSPGADVERNYYMQ